MMLRVFLVRRPQSQDLLYWRSILPAFQFKVQQPRRITSIPLLSDSPHHSLRGCTYFKLLPNSLMAPYYIEPGRSITRLCLVCLWLYEEGRNILEDTCNNVAKSLRAIIIWRFDSLCSTPWPLPGDSAPIACRPWKIVFPQHLLAPSMPFDWEEHVIHIALP